MKRGGSESDVTLSEKHIIIFSRFGLLTYLIVPHGIRESRRVAVTYNIIGRVRNTIIPGCIPFIVKGSHLHSAINIIIKNNFKESL